MFMDTKVHIIWILVTLVLISACKPEIESFQASPRHICEGQEITLSWQIKGKAILGSQPPIDGTGPVSDIATAGFKPRSDTRFILTVMRGGKNDYAEQDIVVFSNKVEQEIVIRTKPDGQGGLVAIETLKPEVWDDMIRVMSISSLSRRSIRVIHNGRSITLSGDGTSSEELKGQKLSGTWELRANLLPGEVMRDPKNPPPDRLGILVILSCINTGE